MFCTFNAHGQTNIDSSIKFLIKQNYRFLPMEFGPLAIPNQHSSTKYSTTIKDWPIFCRLEEQFRVKHKIPIKFRLGSFDYVEKLENK